MLEAFNSICEFRQLNPGTRGSALFSNDPKLIDVKRNLLIIENWLKDKFQYYKGITYNFEHSKGQTYFPSVLHVSLLPPGQQVSKGIYVVICFDLLGRGALIGCAESKTNPQGLNTVNRTITKNLSINVDGLRKTTKYNNTFENPKEFIYGAAKIQEIEQHLRKSLELCLYHLKLIQNPDLNIETFVYATADPEFNPDNITTAKEKIARYISNRRGQQTFRERLLEIYHGQCVITKCDVVETLEAAHIVPYNGKQTNSISNGLLLRADIHTLFDLGLITINADNFTVKIAKKLYNSIYSELNNKRINLPDTDKLYPSKHALEYHNQTFQE